MKHLQALKSNHIFFMLDSCMTFRHLYKITRITIFLECIASQTNFENPVPDASVKVYEYFTSPQGRQMNEHNIASWRSLTERIGQPSNISKYCSHLSLIDLRRLNTLRIIVWLSHRQERLQCWNNFPSEHLSMIILAIFSVYEIETAL